MPDLTRTLNPRALSANVAMRHRQEQGMNGKGKRVGLFVTCLVDLFRPIGRLCGGQAAGGRRLHGRGAARRPAAASRPSIPATATDARRSREQVIDGFRAATTTSSRRPAPARGMLKAHYPELFRRRSATGCRAPMRFAAKTYELVSFLVDVLEVDACRRALRRRPSTYHDSCSGLRELGVQDAAAPAARHRRRADAEGMRDADVCCGFGGTFCVKYPDISNAIVEKKAAHIAATGADTLLAGDLGCLMNMAGKLQREGKADRGAPCRRGARRHDRRARDRAPTKPEAAR